MVSYSARRLAILILDTCKRPGVYIQDALNSFITFHCQSYIFFWIWLSLLFPKGATLQRVNMVTFTLSLPKWSKTPCQRLLSPSLDRSQSAFGRPCVLFFTVQSQRTNSWMIHRHHCHHRRRYHHCRCHYHLKSGTWFSNMISVVSFLLHAQHLSFQDSELRKGGYQ